MIERFLVNFLFSAATQEYKKILEGYKDPKNIYIYTTINAENAILDFLYVWEE